MTNKTFALIMAGLLAALLLLTAAAQAEKSKEWRSFAKKPVNLLLPSGETERCLTCHQGIEEISPAHPVEVMGCVACHGGNGLALEQETAHSGLLGGNNPSDLQFAREACGGEGNCHSGRGTAYQSPADTVPLIPMATKAGEIAEAARTLTWQKGSDSQFAVKAVQESFAALPQELLEERKIEGPEAVLQQFIAAVDLPGSEKFSANCLTYCHLNSGVGTEPAETGSRQQEHLGGCAACHVPYQSGGTYQGGDASLDKSEPGHAPEHRLTTAITYNQCNSCHNQGVHSISELTFFPRNDVPAAAVTSPLADRELVYYIPQASYAACEVDLDCIDCHSHNEVMGDGHLYGNKEKAQVISCYNCHGTSEKPPSWQMITSEQDTALWASGNLAQDFPELKLGETVAVTDRAEPMPNVRLEDGEAVLYSKINGQKLSIPLVMGSGCLQNEDEQKGEACHRCHDISSNASSR